MKVAVIVPGATGGLVAGYLKEQGEDVTLIGPKDTVDVIDKNGLSISGVRGIVRVKIPAATHLHKKVDATDYLFVRYYRNKLIIFISMQNSNR